MKKFSLLLTVAVLVAASCIRIPANYVGVLIENCGQNGIDDFSIVQGKVNTTGICTELLQIPTFEQKGDIQPFDIRTIDGGVFTVDPFYAYQAIRAKAREIAYNYSEYKGSEDQFLDKVEENILNHRIYNEYLDLGRTYTTDSLLYNMAGFEEQVELNVAKVMEEAHFTLINITSDLQPPQSMQLAIDARNDVNIEAEQLQNKINKERAQIALEVERAKSQLEIERYTTQANLEKSRGLTDQILREKAIEGWIKAGCPMPAAVGGDNSLIDIATAKPIIGKKPN